MHLPFHWQSTRDLSQLSQTHLQLKNTRDAGFWPKHRLTKQSLAAFALPDACESYTITPAATMDDLPPELGGGSVEDPSARTRVVKNKYNLACQVGLQH